MTVFEFLINIVFNLYKLFLIGALMGQNVIIAMSALKGQLAKQMKISIYEINHLFDEFQAETKLIRMYCTYTRVYGKKL